MLSGAPPARSLPAPAGMVEDTLSADLMAARNEMFSSFEGDERKTREMSTGTMEGTMDDSMAVLGGGDWTDEGGEDEEEDDEDEDDDDDDESAAEAAIAIKDDKAVVGALASFVEDCFSSKLFSEEEIGALDVLLGGGKPVPVTSPRGSSGGGIDPVVRAAYLVSYAQGRDAQLLFAVLKDLAAKQLTPDGREEHVAQEELIDMVICLPTTKSKHTKSQVVKNSPALNCVSASLLTCVRFALSPLSLGSRVGRRGALERDWNAPFVQPYRAQGSRHRRHLQGVRRAL